MKKVLLAVTASIAAHKAVDIVKALTKQNYDVKVLMSKNATKFVTPFTFEVLTGHKVGIEIMEEDEPGKVQHIDLGKECDVFIVAPATANTIAKLANGFADNLITATALALPPEKKKIIVPAMNTKMYENPAFQRNLNQLKADGYIEVEPRESILACGDRGKGALAKLEDILKAIA